MCDTGPSQIHSKTTEEAAPLSSDKKCSSSRTWWLAGLPLIGYLFVMISRHPYLSLGTLAVAGYGAFWYLSRNKRHWDRLVIGSNSIFRNVLGKFGLKLLNEKEKDVKTSPPAIVLERNAARESALALGPFDLPDDESNIRFDAPGDQSAPGGPKLKAATEVKLIERLCYYPILDSDFTTTFLITYRSFTTPDVLLELLIRRYNEPPPPNPTSTKVPNANNDLRPRVCNILKLWVSEFWKDFETDPALRSALFDFVNDRVVGKDGAKFGSNLQSLIKDKTEAENISRQHKRQSTVLVDLQHLPPPCEKREPLFEKILAVDVEQLAQQITLIESRLFGSIAVFEFLDQNWSRPHKSGKAPQILKKIESFNRLNAFVVTHIVSTEQLKDRAKVIKRYIRMASECKKINNYDSTMAIISALQGASVGRLTNTWAEVPKAIRTTFNELTDFINPKSNYKNYRTELASHTGPVVPYMGVWLSDLTFIDDGNSKFIVPNTGSSQPVSEPSTPGNRLVNFDKCRMVSKCLRSIHSTQLAQYRMPGNREIQEMIMGCHAPGISLTESEAYKCSLICEKRRPTSS